MKTSESTAPPPRGPVQRGIKIAGMFTDDELLDILGMVQRIERLRPHQEFTTIVDDPKATREEVEGLLTRLPLAPGYERLRDMTPVGRWRVRWTEPGGQSRIQDCNDEAEARALYDRVATAHINGQYALQGVPSPELIEPTGVVAGSAPDRGELIARLKRIQEKVNTADWLTRAESPNRFAQFCSEIERIIDIDNLEGHP